MLKNTGGIFLHLDRYANYYGRILLNDIFGKSCSRVERKASMGTIMDRLNDLVKE